MVDRVPDVAGESSTHILTESESVSWQHALSSAANFFASRATRLREGVEGRMAASPTEIETLAKQFERQSKEALHAAALLADADRVEIVRTAPKGGAA